MYRAYCTVSRIKAALRKTLNSNLLWSAIRTGDEVRFVMRTTVAGTRTDDTIGYALDNCRKRRETDTGWDGGYELSLKRRMF